MWFEVVLFLLLQPGLLLTIPPVGKKIFMSGKTSVTAIMVHALIFAAIIYFKSSIPILRDIEGFAPSKGGRIFYRCDGKVTNDINTDCLNMLYNEVNNGVPNIVYQSSYLNSKAAVVNALNLIKNLINEVNTRVISVSNTSECKERLRKVPERAKHLDGLLTALDNAKAAANKAHADYTGLIRELDRAINGTAAQAIVALRLAATAYISLNDLQITLPRLVQKWGHFNYADVKVRKMVLDKLGSSVSFFDKDNILSGFLFTRGVVIAIRNELRPYTKMTDAQLALYEAKSREETERMAKEDAAVAAAAERTPVDEKPKADYAPKLPGTWNTNV